MGTYTWTITPNDIDREIKVWQDRNSGNLRNGWDFLAFNYDAEQIINVLKYAKELNKSVLITSSYLFWKADIIYDNYSNNNNENTSRNNTFIYNINTNNANSNIKIDDNNNITINGEADNTKEDNEEKNKNLEQKKRESLDNKEKPIAVIFISADQKIHFPIICYSSESFSSVIEKLYDEYPELNKKNVFFIHNGEIINTSATVELNKIKNGDNILLDFN